MRTPSRRRLRHRRACTAGGESWRRGHRHRRFATAIAQARAKAAERGISARFEVADALDLASHAALSNTVIDSGAFHVFGDDDRVQVRRAPRGCAAARRHFYLMCFSDRQPGPGAAARSARTNCARRSATGGPSNPYRRALRPQPNGRHYAGSGLACRNRAYLTNRGPARRVRPQDGEGRHRGMGAWRHVSQLPRPWWRSPCTRQLCSLFGRSPLGG